MCVTITPRAAKYMRRMVRFGEGSAAAGFIDHADRLGQVFFQSIGQGTRHQVRPASG